MHKCTILAGSDYIHTIAGACVAQTLASLASGLLLALVSKFPIIPKGVLWEWLSANGAYGAVGWNHGELWGIMVELWGIVGQLWLMYGELWGIMRFYRELCGIMGNGECMSS